MREKAFKIIHGIILILIAVAVCLALIIIFPLSDNDSSETNIAENKISEDNVNNKSTKRNNTQTNNSAIVEAVRAKLIDVGLGRLATGVSSEGGAIFVRGILIEKEQQDWRRVAIWYDSHYGASVPLILRVGQETKYQIPINIKAVWLQDKPYIVDANGKRYFIGSHVGNGWKIENITNSSVVLIKGDDTVNVSF